MSVAHIYFFRRLIILSYDILTLTNFINNVYQLISFAKSNYYISPIYFMLPHQINAFNQINIFVVERDKPEQITDKGVKTVWGEKVFCICAFYVFAIFLIVRYYLIRLAITLFFLFLLLFIIMFFFLLFYFSS